MQATIQTLKALSDETRLSILLLLCKEEELCVCELTEAMNVSQPKISRHLANLRQQQVLLDRRQGQWVYYRINPDLQTWLQPTLTQLFAENEGFINPLLDRLAKMGNRPERLASCCS